MKIIKIHSVSSTVNIYNYTKTLKRVRSKYGGGGGPEEASTGCTANDFKISLTKGREEAM